MLPRIIAGSSAGSMFASFIATNKPEDIAKVSSILLFQLIARFFKLMEPGTVNLSAFKKTSTMNSFFRRIKRLLTEGYLLDISVVEEFLRDNIGDVTFQVHTMIRFS